MSKLVKYPRTMNFPWSDSNSSDDVWLKDCQQFEGREVVVTEKMDGECTSLYTDHLHARSLDTDSHPSRNWIKQFHATFGYEIPKDYRVCGENVYAFHSIFYTELPSYFLCFGVYTDDNLCLSWDDTLELCELLGVNHVPVIYRGPWDEKLIRSLWKGRGAFPTFATNAELPIWPDTFQPTDAEGYVVRLASAFPYEQFKTSVGKYVRPNHVTTPTNWLQRDVLPNRLRTA